MANEDRHDPNNEDRTDITPSGGTVKDRRVPDDLPGYEDLPPFRDKFNNDKCVSALKSLEEVATELEPLIQAGNWRADYAYAEIHAAIDNLDQIIFDAHACPKPADYKFSGVHYKGSDEF